MRRCSMSQTRIHPSTPTNDSVLDTVMQFTPAVALTGGAVLGLCAVCKYVVTGRILGISGTVKGLLQGDRRSWRVAFLLGLLGGAVISGYITPAAFDVLPATYTVERAALGGLLVGWGAAMGNGCTSGHGICGNARLSVRLVVLVCVWGLVLGLFLGCGLGLGFGLLCC